MKIIIKPVGALLLMGVIAVLALLAFRNGRNGSSDPSGAAVASSGSVASPKRGPGASLTIYDDRMENGWEAPGWSWAKDVDYDNRQTPHAGTSDIRAQFAPFEGIKFHHVQLIDRTRYDRVTFYIRGGANGVKGLRVALAQNGTAVGKAVELADLPANQWSAVTVPFSQFQLPDSKGVSEVWLQSFNTTQHLHFFMDDLRLIGGSEPDPTGPSIATKPEIP